MGKRVLPSCTQTLPADVMQSAPNVTTSKQKPPNTLEAVYLDLSGWNVDLQGRVPSVIQTSVVRIRTMMVTGDFKLTAHAIARSADHYGRRQQSPHVETFLASHPQKVKKAIRTTTPETVQSAPTENKAIVLTGPDLMTCYRINGPH